MVNQTFVRASLLMILALTLSACSLPRYKDVNAKYVATVPAKSSGSMVVLIQPVFPGKPYDEVVCDNDVGVLWSPTEAKLIGFTQNYAKTLANSPQLAMLATLPPNLAIGMAASGSAGQFNISSRIMVPYGLLIAANLRSLMAQTSPSSLVCLDQECVNTKIAETPTIQVATVQFTKMFVSESKPNRLTLIVDGNVELHRNGQSSLVPFHQEIDDRSITSEGLFHSDFLVAMNIMANEITSAVAKDIVEDVLVGN